MTNRKMDIAKAIYLTLVEHALNRETTTYEALAVKHGLPSCGSQLGTVLSPYLSDIFMWCNGRGQPHLTSLVVRKSTATKGIPGKGFWQLFGVLGTPSYMELTLAEQRLLTKTFQDQVYCYFGTI